MQTHLVYNTPTGRVSKRLRDDHALAEGQHALDTFKTSRVFLRTEGKNILWAMHRGLNGQYLMAGTLIRKRGKSVKIPVTVLK